MPTEPYVVLSWHCLPNYIAPPRFSGRQFTVCRAYGPGPASSIAGDVPVNGWARRNDANLYQMFNLLNPRRPVDLVVVAVDGLRNNLPVGLDRFRCPKLLLVADTHQGVAPISGLLEYAEKWRFDSVAMLYTRQHAHWFREAGFERVEWLPGLAAERPGNLPAIERRPTIGFAGQTTDRFPRRQRLLGALLANGLKLNAGTVRRYKLHAFLARSRVGFNCSLNGDLNLRVFETVLNGAILLTDRLAPAAGLDLLFEEGRHYLGYGTPEELVEAARRALQDTGLDDMARCAADRLAELRLDVDLARRAAEWALGGALPFEIGLSADPRSATASSPQQMRFRLSFYELAQDLHLDSETMNAWLGADAPATLAVDLLDLPRLRLYLDSAHSGALEELDRMGLRSRCTIVAADDIAGQAFDLAIGGGLPPRVKATHRFDPADADAAMAVQCDRSLNRVRKLKNLTLKPPA